MNNGEAEVKVAEEKCGRFICAWCVPPRDMGPAPGFRSGEFSHGICPGCRQKYFPGVGERSAARAAGANGGDNGGRADWPVGGTAG